MGPDTPIFVKVHDWSLWLFQKTAGFPKRLRYSLTQRLENDTLELEKTLLRAQYSRGRQRSIHLDEADALLAGLRLNVRRCYDMKALAAKGYEFAARQLNEMGALLGAWKRHHDRRAS